MIGGIQVTVFVLTEAEAERVLSWADTQDFPASYAPYDNEDDA